MAKAKPLSERRKVWAKKISRWNRGIIKASNLLRNFCHAPGCTGPNVCPKSHGHARCYKRLGIHTAIAWQIWGEFKDDVIEPLFEARFLLKSGSVGWAYCHIMSAQKSLAQINRTLYTLYGAGGMHASSDLEPMWAGLKDIIPRVRHDTAVFHTPGRLYELAQTIKRASQKAGVESGYFDEQY